MPTRFGILPHAIDGKTPTPAQKVKTAKSLNLTLVRMPWYTDDAQGQENLLQAYKDANFAIQLNLNYQRSSEFGDEKPFNKSYPKITWKFLKNVEICISKIEPNLSVCCVENEPLNRRYFVTDKDFDYYLELIACQCVGLTNSVAVMCGGLPAEALHAYFTTPAGRIQHPQVIRVKLFLDFIKKTPSLFLNYHFNTAWLDFNSNQLKTINDRIKSDYELQPYCNEFHFTKTDPITIEKTVEKIVQSNLQTAIIISGKKSTEGHQPLTDVEGNLNRAGELFLTAVEKYNK